LARRLPGRATAEGTRRYEARLAARTAPGHFRALGDELALSTLGIGTYLGAEDGATDVLYQDAMTRALDLGINVVDTAVNYRHQRSERAIRTALAGVVARGAGQRDEVVVATKGGFIPFDGAVPRDARGWFTATYLETGIVGPGDVVGGIHCMTPRYLADQIERSRANLGLETVDVYYLHNPETQLGEVAQADFLARLRAAFEALEQAARDGRIGMYGVATWNGFRQDPGAQDYLSLAELVGAARDVGGPDHRFRAIQLPYNLAMPEAFTRANQRVGDDVVTTLEAARRLGLYVVTSASLYQGQLTHGLPSLVGEILVDLQTDAQRALQFARSTPGVGTALVGMKSTAHVEESAGVATRPPVSWTEFRRLFSPADG